MKVLVVGGVAGGATMAARLRRLDETAEIVLLEKGAHISFANCGLPYHIGGAIQDEAKLLLQTPQNFSDRFHIDVRVLHEALAIDRAAHTVRVQAADGTVYDEHYDKLVLSPGANPIVPNMEHAEDPRVFTLRNIPDTKRILSFVRERHPERAVVVGCGYIGLELVENLTIAGVSVTAVDLADSVIAPLDRDMAAEVHAYLESKGITLLLSSPLTAIELADNGLTLVAGNHRLPTDIVILALGVRPETALAKNAELSLNGKGFLIVNDHMQTNDPDIYAIGDAAEVKNLVTGLPASIPLAGPANRQARICADHIAGIDSRYRGAQGTAILKLFDMTIAVTGINETTAATLSIPYGKVYTYSSSHADYYPGATKMSIKALYEQQSGVILGAQLVGFDGVDKRADLLAVAVRSRMTADDLVNFELCYAPPFSSAKDPVNIVGFVIENERRNLVRQCFWHDIPALQLDDNTVLLDVRSEAEYAMGHVEGAFNIPLNELRRRIDELPNDKTVCVICLSGARSYYACRILSGHGIPCLNLAGGYRFWRLVTKDISKHPVFDQQATKKTAIDSLTKDYFHKYGLSCSESTIEMLQLLGKIPDVPELTQSMGGFAGGIHRGLTCGAVSGAIAALGAYCGRNLRGTAKEPLNSAVNEFLATFEQRFGSLDCQTLVKNSGLSLEEQHKVCTGYVSAAVTLAAEIIDRLPKRK